MAKKTKKQTRKVSGSRPVMETRSTSVQESVSAIPATRVSSSDFNPDYSQTIKDLKRIGALAGSFFIVLVIISFFLR